MSVFNVKRSEVRKASSEINRMKRIKNIRKNNFLTGIVEDVKNHNYTDALAKIKLALAGGNINNLVDQWAIEMLGTKPKCNDGAVRYFENEENLKTFLNHIITLALNDNDYVAAVFAFDMLLKVDPSEENRERALELIAGIKNIDLKVLRYEKNKTIFGENKLIGVKHPHTILMNMYEIAGDIIYKHVPKDGVRFVRSKYLGLVKEETMITTVDSALFYQKSIEEAKRSSTETGLFKVKKFVDRKIEIARLYAKMGRFDKAEEMIENLHYPDAIRAFLRITTEPSVPKEIKEHFTKRAVEVAIEYVFYYSTFLEFTTGIKQVSSKQNKIIEVMTEEVTLADKLSKDTRYIRKFSALESEQYHKLKEKDVKPKSIWQLLD